MRRLSATRPAVQRIPCGAVPYRCPPNVPWPDSLHTGVPDAFAADASYRYSCPCSRRTRSPEAMPRSFTTGAPRGASRASSAGAIRSAARIRASGAAIPRTRSPPRRTRTNRVLRPGAAPGCRSPAGGALHGRSTSARRRSGCIAGMSPSPAFGRGWGRKTLPEHPRLHLHEENMYNINKLDPNRPRGPIPLPPASPLCNAPEHFKNQPRKPPRNLQMTMHVP